MAPEPSLMSPDLDACIREQMARWTVPGAVLGLLHGSERATRAYGVASLETGYPVRPDTLFPIGSISKVYTAALVMTGDRSEGQLFPGLYASPQPPGRGTLVRRGHHRLVQTAVMDQPDEEPGSAP